LHSANKQIQKTLELENLHGKRDAVRDAKTSSTSDKRCRAEKRQQREVRMLLVMEDVTKGSKTSIIKRRQEDAGKTK